MKRFFLLFLFASFCIFGFGQNLIPNPSAEEYIECPTGLGIMESWVSNWLSLKGTPDYFNDCSNILGSNNPFGFQVPRTGDAYLTLYTFRRNPVNQREFFGIQLDNPLEIGQTYYMSFYVSRAHQPNAFNLASNNIGVLFMLENYIDSNTDGLIPNMSTYHTENLIEDTTNWVNLSFDFIADSAYQFVVFGNFFDNTLTDTLRIGGEPDGNVTSYYYFDDFCLSTNPDDCDLPMSNVTIPSGADMRIQIFPNPASTEIQVKSDWNIESISIEDLNGRIVLSEISQSSVVDVSHLPPGIYIVSVKTEQGVQNQKFIKTP